MKNPKISIITPSFNCEKFIRDCIESILAQNYGNFEHIIVDGASRDGTVEILKSYKHLKWISEPDKGEAEALNKALKLVSGDIICWLNADDYLVAGAFQKVLKKIDPENNIHVVYGRTRILDDADNFSWEKNPRRDMSFAHLLKLWRHHTMPHQPSMFFSRVVIEAVGSYRQDLHYCIDAEMWLRMRRMFKFYKIDSVLSVARLERKGAKSEGDDAEQVRAFQEMIKPYFTDLSSSQKILYHTDRIWFRAGQIIFGRLRYLLKIRTRLKRFRDFLLRRQYGY